MGGYGSGRRWGVPPKPTTDEYPALDVRWLAKEGLLRPGRYFELAWDADTRLKIKVADTYITFFPPYGEGRRIPLDRTPCHLGGERHWLRCPDCGRRVAVLYLDQWSLLTCRVCLGAVYQSQRETVMDRLTRRLNKIRRRLGWPVGVLNPPGGRPKGMHWRTFERLKREHDALASVILQRLGEDAMKML